ncbi:MAG TPA: glycosyltransferase family 4 protein [Opitutaceae bacterium]|nr:glycosyltransferase family 4 protein [Opitutaceae bacterium]
MRLTIVTSFFLPVPPIRGGSTEKIWSRLASEFVAAGHEVTFVSRRWPDLATQEIVDGVNHLRLRGATHHRSLAVNLWHDAWWGFRVARHLPAADFVICNTVTLPAWLRWIKRSAGRVVAVIGRMPKGHGRAYGNVDLLLAVSDAVSRKLRAENPRLEHRIRLFPCPIDWHLHAEAGARRSATLPRRTPSTLVIGYVGRIHPEKGLDLLLAAATRLVGRPDLPPWRVELVGPWAIPDGGGGDGYRDALERKFGAALGDRLSFVGPEFNAAALANRYARFDVFCYPSIAEAGETFGVSVAEAMATGCSTLVSALPCFRELVRPEENGLIFDHSGADAVDRLAGTLIRLLSDAVLRDRLAARAQAHVRQYDYGECARRLLSDFEQIVRPS